MAWPWSKRNAQITAEDLLGWQTAARSGQGPLANTSVSREQAMRHSAYWACLILREIGPEAKAATGALTAKLKDPRPEIRREATLALASTGTVTMECAWFGVPTVTFYKTSWSTYQIGKRIIRVPYLAMPNILAGAPVFPEFIQHDATPEHLSRAVLDLRSLKFTDSTGSIDDSLGRDLVA